VASNEAALVRLIRQQIASAECLIKLMRSDKVQFGCYEETVRIGD
jgi:hypothetical protein